MATHKDVFNGDNPINRVLLSLGSNKGVRMEKINQALNYLVDNDIEIVAKSDWFMTSPWGFTNQDWFVNIAVEINTQLNAFELLSLCQQTEKFVGRTHEAKWGPREIDIDILYYNQAVIDTEILKVPHPHLYHRNFVLEPLNQIAPDWMDPVKSETISDILKQCNDHGEVKVVEPSFGLI